MTAARENDGRWSKGCKSPNPTGRPKGIRAKAKEACAKYGIDPFEYFASVVANDKETTKNRIDCAKILVEYVAGKPIAYTENTNVEINDKEFKITFVGTNQDGSTDT